MSGTLLGFAFPPFNFGLFALIGFIPFFIVFENLNTLGRTFRYSYIVFFVMNLIACYWVGGFGNDVDIFLMISGIALSLAHPLFFFIPVLFLYIVKKAYGKNTSLLVFPFLWVSFEYLHSITEFAFPWLLLGNTQTYDFSRIQYISYTGVYGISFWIISINILMYSLYNHLVVEKKRGIDIKSIILVVSLVTLYVLPSIFYKVIVSDYLYSDKTIEISIVQPNINPWDKWKQSREFDQVIEIMGLTSDGLKNKKPDLIVWPETAIPFYIKFPSRQEELESVTRYVDSINTNLLTGSVDMKIYSSDGHVPPSSKKSRSSDFAYDSYNSVMFFQPQNNIIPIFHKMKLVPFSERIPYLDYYPFLINFLQWGVGISNWGIGRDTIIFELKKNITLNEASTFDLKFCSMICYESIFPGFVAGFVKKGAEFIVIITNDSWFGNSSGPYQHNQYAILRAIENRRSVVRCANGGVSSFITPLGEMVMKTDFMTKTVITNSVVAEDKLTFYSKHGDIFSNICLYLSILLIVWGLVLSIIKKTKNKVKYDRNN
jgi:apolipoprotein N-acyltransferase